MPRRPLRSAAVRRIGWEGRRERRKKRKEKRERERENENRNKK